MRFGLIEKGKSSAAEVTGVFVGREETDASLG
jgi:hypothetical protein